MPRNAMRRALSKIEEPQLLFQPPNLSARRGSGWLHIFGLGGVQNVRTKLCPQIQNYIYTSIQRC